MVEKVRLKKSQQPKIQQWCTALEISESRFVEDAIAFYLRMLEGKQPVTNVTVESIQLVNVGIETIEDIENPEDYDGGIDL
jgi:hypothetical protein